MTETSPDQYVIPSRDPATIPPLRLGSLLGDIPHALIGGHAVNVWVEPRLTMDIDVLIAGDRSSVDLAASRLVADGFTQTDKHGEARLPADFQRFRSPDGRVVVELLAVRTELQRDVLRRACALHGGLRVATPEDLIVLKLIADRGKDLKDLLDLCALPGLDWGYIERWADTWRVRDRLDSYRARARR